VRFIVSEIQQYDANMPPELVLTFRVLNAVLLLALGGWLIFLAIRENPHEIESLRAQVKLSVTERKIASSAQRSLSASKKLEEAESSLHALKDELDLAVNSSRQELSEAAKSVYRRALINEMGDPEFTRSYFGEVQANDTDK